MVKTILSTSHSNTEPGTTVAGTTEFWLFGYASFEKSTTESTREVLYRSPGTLSKLYVRVTANSTSASSSVTIRKNAADTALTVTIGAAATGEFEETSSSVSIAAGDKLCIKTVSGGTGTFTMTIVSCIWDATTNCNVRYVAKCYSLTAASTTHFLPIAGDRSGTTTGEANVENTIKTAGTIKNGSVNITSNARTTNTTFTVRKNRVDTAMVITAGSGVTGHREDTTNSISYAVDDELDWELTTLTGTQTLVANSLAVDYETTTDRGVLTRGCVGSSGDYIVPSLTTWYVPIGGGAAEGVTTESQVQMKAREAFTFRNLIVYSGTNNVTTNSFVNFRVNGASSALTVTIGAAATGFIADTTHTVTVAAGDLIDFQFVMNGAAAQSMTCRQISITADAPPALTRITQDIILKYNLIARTVQNLVLKYNLVARTVQNLVLKYNIRNFVSKNLILKYNLVARTINNLIFKYHIASRIVNSVILKYNLVARTVQNLIIKYNIRKQIVQNLILKYNLVGRITTNLILKYNLISRMIKGLVLKYNLAARTTQNLILKYNLATRIIQNLIVKYNLRKFVSQNVILKYNNAQMVVQNIILKWNLRNFVSKNLILKYNLIARTVNNLILKYNLRSRIVQNLILKYDIIELGLVRITNDLILKYHMLNFMSQNLTLKYNILNRIANNITIKYNIAARVAQSIITKYNIRNFVTNNLITKYHIANRIVQNLVLKYNTLGRITNNLVIKYNIFEALVRITNDLILKYDILKSVAQSLTVKYDIVGRIKNNLTIKYNIIQEGILRITNNLVIKYNIKKKELPKNLWTSFAGFTVKTLRRPASKPSRRMY